MWRFLLMAVLTGTLTTCPMCHVRCGNARIAEVFAITYARSPAFRELVGALESSDIYVYLEDGRCRKGTVRSCLQLMSATNGVRFLRVNIDSRRPLMSVVGQVAHELRHASEIAGRPEVVDAASLRALYREIGFESCAPHLDESCWETWEARATEQLVRQQTGSFGSVAGLKP